MAPAVPRKNPNRPKYVKVENGRIVWRPYIPASQRHLVKTDKSGFLRPPVRLGNPTDTEDVILKAYLAAKESLELQMRGSDHGTLFWLKEQYHNSRHFLELSEASRKNASVMARMLDHTLTVDGAPAPLGSLHVSVLTKPMLRSLIDKRLQQYQDKKKKGAVMVNRERAWLSAMLSWGMQFIDGLGLATNPCEGIRRIREQPATRYVTDPDYETQAAVAVEIAPWLPVLYEMLYLCAARGIEAADLRSSSLTEKGIEVDRRKGSEDNGILWTQRLRDAVAAAQALHSPTSNVKSLYLIVNTKGERLTKAAIQSAQGRVRERMREQGKGAIYWNLHALKRKGVTDAKNKTIAGHKSEAVRRIYDLSRNWVEPPR